MREFRRRERFERFFENTKGESGIAFFGDEFGAVVRRWWAGG